MYSVNVFKNILRKDKLVLEILLSVSSVVVLLKVFFLYFNFLNFVTCFEDYICTENV